MSLSYPLLHKILLTTCALLLLVAFWSILPPMGFREGQIVEVPEGRGLQEISTLLKKEGIIRSALWFRTFSIILGGERGMKAGQYYFAEPESVPTVAWRIYRGDYELETIKVTVPEGFTIFGISKLFDARFRFFDKNFFEAEAPEGYLFPDTYFLPVTTTAEDAIRLMHDNFIRKIFPLMPEVEMSKRTLEEIVTMASLIEAEADNQEDREIVSSILWKRLNMGMPLQVDVEMKTYEFKGLPEKPINNPGILSITASLRPTSTPYLYYLTGKDGQMRYAKTFDEHKRNIDKYLR